MSEDDSERDGDALAGAEDVDTGVGTRRRSIGDEPVEFVVVVRGVVVEERQLTRSGLGRHPHGEVDGAVAPVALHRELGLGVLRVVDQEVDVSTQLDRTAVAMRTNRRTASGDR